VPSVDVSPSGQVRLIGRSGVTIQIDGQEVPNAGALLRAMQGSEVAKIEVVTNPSAQFSARGTGGIINIITRRRADAGIGGSVTGSVGSFGAYEVRSSPSWGRGKVSLNGGVGISRSVSRLEQREEWDLLETFEGIDRLEIGETESRTDTVSANIRAAVELAPKQNLAIAGQLMDFEGTTSGEAEIFEEDRSRRRSSGRSDMAVRRVSADYRREGSKTGIQTSLSASHQSFKIGTENFYRTEPASDEISSFEVRSKLLGTTTTLKLDHVRPTGSRRLSLGGQFEHSFEDNSQRSTTGSGSGDQVSVETAQAGSWTEAAAYLTYKFPLLGNLVMPGLRVETRRYDIDEVSDDPAGGTHLFPSLHVERKIAKWLTGNLSYSRRISWPSIADLDPRLRFSNPTTARAGNRLLLPETTNSFEVKLMAKAGSHAADLTAFYQKTRDLRSTLVELDEDVLVSRPVNLGTLTSHGANLQVRGPLAKGLSYVLNANLAWQTISDVDLAGFDNANTGYGASIQIEYRDGMEGRAGADHIRLSATFSGPSETGLARISSVVRASASWSHALTDRWSAVATATHFLNSPASTVFGADVVSRQETGFPGPVFNVALTYGLGTRGR
jgi:outer membrane receptor protein involved in Fe transport